MWCFARFGTICKILKTWKKTHGGVLLLVKLQVWAKSLKSVSNTKVLTHIQLKADPLTFAFFAFFFQVIVRSDYMKIVHLHMTIHLWLSHGRRQCDVLRFSTCLGILLFLTKYLFSSFADVINAWPLRRVYSVACSRSGDDCKWKRLQSYFAFRYIG